MDSIHFMWLFFALLLSVIGISFCIDCQHPALPVSTVTVSSTLSSNYGKEKIEDLSDDPWVGNGSLFSSNWFSVAFPKPIILTNIKITGGSVDVYGNGSSVTCYVEVFLLFYNTETKSGIRFGKLRNASGNYNEIVDLKESITSINITIKRFIGCPAVNLKLLACGVCEKPNDKDKQLLTCTTAMQECTYSCEQGYKPRDGKSGVKMCQLDGTWSGPDLICDDEDECTNDRNICGNNANCENKPGSYTCNCHPGYATGGSSFCSDVNECTDGSNTCHQTLATCTNTRGSYSCHCNNGYTGDGRTCTDVNECKDGSKPCHRLATCTNAQGSYSCHCNNGYTGDGRGCTDIDECASHLDTCDDRERASCWNSLGSFSCTCRRGYSGDGQTCTDIDECKDGSNTCHQTLATCRNTDGSYSCHCNNGYTGDGRSCTDIDECEQNRCHKYANCANTPGSFNCTCKEGYREVEKNCTGNKVYISNKTPTPVTVRYGEKLQLYCQAEGLPLPTLVWEAPRKHIPRIFHHEESVKSTLVINSVMLSDRGSYKCIARNNETNDNGEILVKVIGTPISPEITNTEAGAKFINFTWNKPSDEGASRINGYKVHYKPPGKYFTLEATQLSLKIYDLTPNTEYVIWVKALNDEGASDQSLFQLTTLAPKPVTVNLPQIKEGGISTSSVTIQVKKIDSEYNINLQVVVEKAPQRRKREASDLPWLQTIHDYENANCSRKSNCFYIAAELENEDNDFVVGDGNMYGKYLNNELEPGTAYNIYTRGISYNNANPKVENIGEPAGPLKLSTAAPAKNKSEDGGSVVAIAVGLTVFLVVVVVLVLLAVLYIRSRRPKTVEIDPETGEKKGRRRKINSELLPLTRKGHGKRKSAQVEDGSPDPNHPPVPTSGFAKYVGKLHKSDDRGFMIQYNTLDTSQTYTSEFATCPENKEKNRYANIVAYDVSRVHLKQVDDDDNSTYINASFVDGYNSANAYIATQGPLPGTFNDFWRMIWERNCSSIVMLTNLQERHKLKCHKYWPEESEAYGDITVTATRREQYADYVIRTFLLKMNETEEEREIKQFHFTVWPDHGVPEYPTAILAFQRRVRAYSTRDSGPLAVHCSAGVGRSGTFIVIDCMLAQIQQEQTVDIYNRVRYLRTRRMFMVQTEEQYVFCHDALLESILCGNTEMAAHNLRIEMNRLRQNNATTKMTGYESEFKTLNKVSPSLPKESFVVATYAENVSKNRYHDILASDHGRVILGDSEEKAEDGPYINAVFVDGYKQQNAFILTQAPLKTTINDFWRMLYEKHSACVVLLSELAEEEGEFPQFWPDEGTEAYDTLNVELVADQSKGDTESVDQFQQINPSDDIVERKFKLSKEEEKSLTVKMFQHLSWKETSVPSDISGIISLIQSIEKWQQHSGNGPITVICNDGQGRSGTFAALCSVLERVKTEQVVDVFQAIKALRIQRPGLVKHVDQYQFIHLGVQEYLDSFSDYANFK